MPDVSIFLAELSDEDAMNRRVASQAPIIKILAGCLAAWLTAIAYLL
jgi:hypothetical protein